MGLYVGRPLSSPYIVAVGGTLRANSSTERAMRYVLAAAERELDFLPALTDGIELFEAETDGTVAQHRRYREGRAAHAGDRAKVIENATEESFRASAIVARGARVEMELDQTIGAEAG